MVNIEQAINSFGSYNYKINGECKTEEDFNKIIWYKTPDEDGNLEVGTKPTELIWSKVNTKWEELKTDYTSKDYARARAVEYPVTTEFIEAYTEKEILNDDTKWNEYVSKYNQVRTDNPKE